MASSIQKFDFEHMTTAIADQVKAKLATKQDTLQLDASPTQNSTNFVNSGAVYTAIKDAEPFTGTTAEWETLTAAEKARYVIVNLIDDTSGGGGESNIKNLTPSDTKELTTTATKAHTQGDYFEVNGSFVKALDDIAIGDTLTEGTNIETTTVGAELTDINEDITTVRNTASSASTNATRALNMARSTSSFPTGDAYSTSSSYSVGDLVIYNNTLYKCKTACSSGSWSSNSSNFKTTSLAGEITDLNSDLSKIGEEVTGTSSPIAYPTDTTFHTFGTITLTPGVWIICYNGYVPFASYGVPAFYLAVSAVDDYVVFYNTSSTKVTQFSFALVVTPSSTTTYNIKYKKNDNASVPAGTTYGLAVSAIRIA